MGFGQECLLVQLALTVDMKAVHEVVSHSHLQKAFWTTVTCISKRLHSRSEEEQCLRPGKKRCKCHKSQLDGFFVHLEKMDWSILEILMPLRTSSRSCIGCSSGSL